MRTIAESIVELTTTKDKLVHNLEVDGQVPEGKTFSQMVDMPFDAEYDVDDGVYTIEDFPIDLSTWTADGEISFIYSNNYEGAINHQVGTTSGNFRMIVHDGVNEIYNASFTRDAVAGYNMTKGNGEVIWAVKFSPVVAGQKLTYCRVIKPASVTMAYYNIGMRLAYVNTDSLTTMYSMFNHAGSSKSPLLEKVYIKSTKNVTSMTYMCYDCRALKVISCPDWDTSKVVTFTYCFYQCNMLKWIPMTTTTNIATDVQGMFNACYMLRKIPALVFREDVAVNFGTMFSGCFSLEVFPARMNTSKSTSMDSVFANCYNLKVVPEGVSTDNATTMYNLFNSCYNLTEIPNFNTSNVTTMAYTFNGCRNLKKLPALSDISKVTRMEGFATDDCAINDGFTLDLSTAPTTLQIFVTTTVNALRGLIVNPLTTWSASGTVIDIYSSGLDRTALIALFNSLGTVVGKTIRITNSLGASSLTAADLLIATNKGWTVNKTT